MKVSNCCKADMFDKGGDLLCCECNMPCTPTESPEPVKDCDNCRFCEDMPDSFPCKDCIEKGDDNYLLWQPAAKPSAEDVLGREFIIMPKVKIPFGELCDYCRFPYYQNSGFKDDGLKCRLFNEGLDRDEMGHYIKCESCLNFNNKSEEK